MFTNHSIVRFLPRLRLVTVLLAAGTVSLGRDAHAQVLVRANASATAQQGSQFPGSNATNDNGVISTTVGNGGSASASPAGSGITRAEALAEQPGSTGSTPMRAGTTTRVDLANAGHIGAVLNTPIDSFGAPGGTSDGRLEDIVTFVNTTAAPVDVPVSWTIDGLITPPSAPHLPSYELVAAMRLIAYGSASPGLRGSPYGHNQVELWTSTNSARSYRDSNAGSVFQPGAGAIWNITPLNDNGARIRGTLVVPVGVSTLRVANSFYLRCQAGTSCDFSLIGARMALDALPAGVTMASASGAFLGAPRPTPVPSGLSVQAIVGNTVTLRWAPPSSAVATGYVLQGGIAPGQTLASVPTGSTATTFTFTAPTGIFYLRMVAQTAGGTSAPSNEVLAYINVPAPPATPTGLLGLASGSQLALSWRNSAGGGTPTSMQLDVSGALAASLPLPVGETFAFNGVPSGTYTFAVRAANTTGTSAASAPVTLTFPSACPGAPLAPANFQAARAGNQLALTWDPPASGPAISSYVLTVSGPLSAAIPLATRSIGGPVPPGTYTLTVRAVNPCGPGAASVAQTVTVP